MRVDHLRLLDILDAVDEIERYTSRGRQDFDHQELIRVWVIHHLQIIGEAAGGLTDTFQHGHPDVPWAQIVAMRNLLVHEYFGVDQNEIWKVVEKDLPPLKTKIRSIVANLEED
jgi:uncharacterized protein with HEPN domain